MCLLDKYHCGCYCCYCGCYALSWSIALWVLSSSWNPSRNTLGLEIPKRSTTVVILITIMLIILFTYFFHPRYGQIISTKAILDKATNRCKVRAWWLLLAPTEELFTVTLIWRCVIINSNRGTLNCILLWEKSSFSFIARYAWVMGIVM